MGGDNEIVRLYSHIEARLTAWKFMTVTRCGSPALPGKPLRQCCEQNPQLAMLKFRREDILVMSANLCLLAPL